MRPFTKYLSAIATLLALSGGSARAEEQVFIFSTNVPAANPSNDNIYKPLAEAINAAGKGHVRIDLRIGATLSNLGNFYERVTADVVQVTNGIISGVVGKFDKTAVITLPFEVESSEVASVAYWRLYKSGMLASDFNEVILLAPIGYPPSTLHLKRPVPAADRLDGVKIGAGTAVSAETVKALNGTAISVQLGDIYESLQRGVADGTVMTWTAFPTFKLYEVTNYHLEVPLGGAAGGPVMNKKRFDGLSAEGRKAIIENSGEQWARLGGKYFDAIQERGKKETAAMNGQQIVTPTPEQLAAYRKKLEYITDEWVKKTPDGDKVLAKFREFTAEVKAGR